MPKTEQKFKTHFTAIGEHYHAPTGSRTEMKHRASIGLDGRRVLIRDKEVAIYDLIQSHKEECEIENIIRRATEGDYNALNVVNGVFQDITNCPNSLAEAQQHIINAKMEFEKLPKDIKAKFEFNPEIYISMLDLDPKTWLEYTGFAKEIELNRAGAEEKLKNDANFNKAMEMLATGQIVKSGETGGESNES